MELALQIFAVPANWDFASHGATEPTEVFERCSNGVVIHHEGHEDTKCCRGILRCHLNANARLTLAPPDGGPVRSGPSVSYAGLDSRSELLRPALLAYTRETLR